MLYPNREEDRSESQTTVVLAQTPHFCGPTSSSTSFPGYFCGSHLEFTLRTATRSRPFIGHQWRVRQDSNLQPSDPKFGPAGFCPVVTSCTKLQILDIIRAFRVR